MREYIFYVILIFIPIAMVMAHLLRKDGLPIKNIAVIIITSLLIIITFPISMAQMGTALSLTVYLLLLLVITRSLIKTGIECSQSENEVHRTDLSNHQALQDQDMVDEAEAVIAPNQGREYPSMPEAEPLDTLLDEEEPLPDFSIIAMQPEIAETEARSSISSEVEPHQDEVVTISNPSQLETGDILTPCEQVPAGISAGKASSEIIEVVGQDDLTDSAEGAGQPNLLEPAAVTEQNPPDSAKGGLTHTDCPVVPDPVNQKLLDLIDSGFSAKIDNQLSMAIKYFQEAWDLTRDPELKYLLTMELVDIFKDLGSYTAGEKILAEFLEFGEHHTDIINEVTHQLTYLRLIAEEVGRLGLGNIPVSRLPRWVRLKVAEELQVQKIG